MNNIELVAILKNMVKEKYGYVWGAVGELYTPKLAVGKTKKEEEFLLRHGTKTHITQSTVRSGLITE